MPSENIMKHHRLASISTLLLLMLFASPVYAGSLSTAVNALGNVSHASIGLTAVRVSSSMAVPDTVPFCQHGNLICYTPQDIKTAYNFPSNLDGSGQTIVIVDAFGSPSVASDLNAFDRIFGLQAPAFFTVVCPAGGCPTLDLSGSNAQSLNEIGWTQEIALDTQWAHAMAPAANIILAVATSDDNFALNAALQNAVNQYPGSIISQSFGTPEGVLNLSKGSADSAFLKQAEQIYKQAAGEGTTVFASAGDWGADFSAIVPNLNFANAGYPASSPEVTAVGGTQGNPYLYHSPIPLCHTTSCSTGLVQFDNSTGTCTRFTSSLHQPFCTATGYGEEQVWNEQQFAVATGGAPSLVFSTPSYQSGLGLSSRTTPDVSYDAAISGGVLGVWTPVPFIAGVYVFGGTSAGSPQWSGIAALANQLDQQQYGQHLGFINRAIYRIGHNPQDFHDITIGNNLVAGGTVGFSAQAGYDDTSGWGTPNVANLVPDLLQASQN
jgi:subtilase family serine protease